MGQAASSLLATRLMYFDLMLVAWANERFLTEGMVLILSRLLIHQRNPVHPL
jgi:hypothetical protein